MLKIDPHANVKKISLKIILKSQTTRRNTSPPPHCLDFFVQYTIIKESQMNIKMASVKKSLQKILTQFGKIASQSVDMLAPKQCLRGGFHKGQKLGGSNFVLYAILFKRFFMAQSKNCLGQCISIHKIDPCSPSTLFDTYGLNIKNVIQIIVILS